MQDFLSNHRKKRREARSEDELDTSVVNHTISTNASVAGVAETEDTFPANRSNSANAGGAGDTKNVHTVTDRSSMPEDRTWWQHFNATTCVQCTSFRGKLKQGGNTCYMSAALQALYHMPSWERVIARLQCTCDLDICPSCQLRRTYQSSALPQSTFALSAWNSFLENVSMRPGAQHDAEEFLKVLVSEWEISQRLAPSARQDIAPSEMHSAQINGYAVVRSFRAST